MQMGFVCGKAAAPEWYTFIKIWKLNEKSWFPLIWLGVSRSGKTKILFNARTRLNWTQVFELCTFNVSIWNENEEKLHRNTTSQTTHTYLRYHLANVCWAHCTNRIYLFAQQIDTSGVAIREREREIARKDINFQVVCCLLYHSIVFKRSVKALAMRDFLCMCVNL